MGYYYWDPTYILVVIGAVICMIASARVKGTFNKYSQLRSMSGMNGAQVAQRVLQAAGIYDVQVRHVSGSLTDHYDPRTKTVNLSDPVYNATSVAAELDHLDGHLYVEKVEGALHDVTYEDTQE